MDDPATVKLGTTQEGMASKAGIPGEAPAFGLRKKESALPPVVVCDINPVLAPFGFERRAVQQSVALTQKPLSASERNGPVRENNDPPRASRECKQRLRPSDQGTQGQRTDGQRQAGRKQRARDQTQQGGFVR